MKFEDIRKLIDEASEGPWKSDHVYVKFPCYKSPSGWDSGALQIDNCDGLCVPTARFIAASRELMPKLLAVAEAARDHMECGADRTDSLRKAISALEAGA